MRGKLLRSGLALVLLMTLALMPEGVPTAAADAWTAQTPGTTSSLLGVDAVDANTAWAVGVSGTIRKTTDGGTNWTGQASNTTSNLFGVSAVDANTAWTVGTAATIRKTTDGGATTWGTQTAPAGTGVLHEVASVSSTVAYAVGEAGSGGRVIKTIDGGTNWLSQTIPAISVALRVYRRWTPASSGLSGPRPLARGLS